MCFAIPGKVVSFDPNTRDTIVTYGSERRDVKAFMIDVEVGDYVIVSNKIIIKKVPKEEALESINLILEEAQEKSSEINPERYFFIYAFPCTFIKLDRGDISKEEYDLLEKTFLEGKFPERRELERVYLPAIKRIKRLAERIKKDYWDYNVIYEYWNKEHNRIIENNEDGYEKHPEYLKDLCKIHMAEIIKKEKGMLLVRYGDKKRAVFNSLVPDAKVGDIVKIHYSYAVEKL